MCGSRTELPQERSDIRRYSGGGLSVSGRCHAILRDPGPGATGFFRGCRPESDPFRLSLLRFQVVRLLYKIFVVFNIYDLSLIPRMDHLAAWPGPIYRAGGDIAWYEKLAFHGTPSQISWQPRFGIADELFRL